MTYWRMQLHPASREDAVAHTIESLAAGYIGLDFAADVGDLLETEQAALPSNQRVYWAFAHGMQEDDFRSYCRTSLPIRIGKGCWSIQLHQASCPGNWRVVSPLPKG